MDDVRLFFNPIVISKFLFKHFDIECACLLSELIRIDEKKEHVDEGWFFVSEKDFSETLFLEKENFEEILSRLVEGGIVSASTSPMGSSHAVLINYEGFSDLINEPWSKYYDKQ